MNSDYDIIEHIIQTACNRSTISTGSTRHTITSIIREGQRYEEEIGEKKSPAKVYEYYVPEVLSVADDDKGITWAYDTELYYTEALIAKYMNWIEKNIKRHVSPEEIIEQVQTELGLRYDDEQRKAFELLKHGVGALTGGPGTGKTALLRGIVRAHQILTNDSPVLLCAPTGMASHRMCEAVQKQARTIHKTLGISLRNDGSIVARRSLPSDALIIIDECSMVDTYLMACITEAAKNARAQLLLVGDEDQLPSVGPGQILHDIIASERFPCVRLRKIYRNSGSIAENAIRIRNGKKDLVEDEQFEIRRKEFCPDLMMAAIREFERHYDKNNPSQVKLLTPVKNEQYETSTQTVNRVIHILHHGKNGPAIAEGEPVIFTKNIPDLDVFNGSEGIVLKVEAEGERIKKVVVKVDGEKKTVDGKYLEYLELSYCVTIHKAQGISCKRAIILLPLEPKSMLTRRLLYVAVTRAEESVTIFSEWDSIDEAISNENEEPRNTGLLDRLKQP